MQFFLYDTLGRLYVDCMFDIMMAYPESEPAARDCAECMKRTNLHRHFVDSLLQALHRRLLHPGDLPHSPPVCSMLMYGGLSGRPEGAVLGGLSCGRRTLCLPHDQPGKAAQHCPSSVGRSSDQWPGRSTKAGRQPDGRWTCPRARWAPSSTCKSLHEHLMHADALSEIAPISSGLVRAPTAPADQSSSLA